MHSRTLGKSGAVVAAQTLGTMTFGSEADEPTSHRIIEAYLDAGGNFLDTADVYSRGTSERIIGTWLAANPKDAERLVITTKGRFPMGDDANDYGASRRHLSRALDASLQRLGVERIDLYQVHAWDALTPLEETLRFLDDAISAGKIDAFGLSNYTGWQITKAALVAEHRGWAPPVTLQVQYSLLARGIEHEVVPAVLDQGIGLLPWSPLAGGWLTGKYRREETPTGASRLGENPERGMEAWSLRKDDEHNWRVIDAVREGAERLGCSPAQLALAWIDRQPGVTSTIIGARSVEQLQANVAALDVEVDDATLQHLTEVSRPQAELYPYGDVAVKQRYRAITP